MICLFRGELFGIFIFFAILTWCLTNKLFEKFGEIGWVVGEYFCYFSNGFICFGKHFFCFINNFVVVKMTGMITCFFLNGVAQVFVGEEKFFRNLVDFHKITYSTRNHIRNMFVQKPKVGLGNFFASRYVLLCLSHLAVCKISQR